MNKRSGSAVVLAAVALTVAGCGSGTVGTSKAGPTATTTVLHLATFDAADQPGGELVDRFVHEVERVSKGTLKIEPAYRAIGVGGLDEQPVVQKVASGDVELGMIASRGFDRTTVRSLDALTAPFLVTNDGLLGAVVSSPDLSGRLMSGLPSLGLTGLGLFPEGLRHPFSWRTPLRAPADFKGALLRVPASRATADLLAALGARPLVEADWNPQAQDGAESSFRTFDASQQGVATGNVTFFPKVDVLVANAKALAGLSAEQRTVLQQAAASARDAALAAVVPDSKQAACFCSDGHAVVLADDAQRAALVQAAQPVTDRLANDPTTRGLIADIQALKGTHPDPTATQACGDAVRAVAVGTPKADTSGTKQDLIDGVYRFQVTDADLAAAGVTDPGLVRENHGVYTYTFQDGKYCGRQKAANALNGVDHWCSTFSLSGHTLQFDDPAVGPETFTWARAKNGDLMLTPVHVADSIAEATVAHPWVRIADAP